MHIGGEVPPRASKHINIGKYRYFGFDIGFMQISNHKEDGISEGSGGCNKNGGF
jgi:hypothetical protein